MTRNQPPRTRGRLARVELLEAVCFVIAAVGVLVFSGCGSSAPVSGKCESASQQQPIVTGTAGPGFLALSPDQVTAIVSVTTEHSLASVPPICTGFAIGPDLVLTTSHCWEGGGIYVHVTQNGQTRAILSKDIVQYPTPGVLLVKLDPTQYQFASFFALGTGDPRIGQRVMAAGYGDDATGKQGALAFIVEEVESVDKQQISITAHGQGGMCNGDSGAPLLVRQADGSVAVLGLLLGGSADCRGTDVFIRTTAMLSWLKQNATLQEPALDCGTLSTEGRCFDGTPTWCEQGQLHVQACQQGTRCGYDPAEAGFRCVSPRADPCDGADSFGQCAGTVALACPGGTLKRTRCPCNSACQYDTSGRPTCL